MHILMITDVYHPRVNGVSTSIATFRRFLQAGGCRVTLIAPHYPGMPETPEPDILRVPGHYLPGDPEDRLVLPSSILRLESQLRQLDLDIIHIHTPFAAHRAGVRLARALNLPLVETYHTYFEAYFHHYIPYLPHCFLKRAARWLTRHQARSVDRLIVPSSALLNVMHDYGVTADVDVAILPTGIDLEEFSASDRSRFCQRHGLDPQRPMLVYIGRVAHEKNIDLLLHAVARLRERVPQLLLIIAGEGPARAHLQRLACDLGIEHNVHFVGYLKRGPELWDCYAAGHAFVFASTTETQGLVLLEAMALGIPVVGVPALGAADVLKEGEGALTVPADSAAFAAAVERLLENPALRAELGQRGRAYAERWSNTAICARLTELYDDVIDRHAMNNPAFNPA